MCASLKKIQERHSAICDCLLRMRAVTRCGGRHVFMIYVYWKPCTSTYTPENQHDIGKSPSSNGGCFIVMLVFGGVYTIHIYINLEEPLRMWFACRNSTLQLEPMVLGICIRCLAGCKWNHSRGSIRRGWWWRWSALLHGLCFKFLHFLGGRRTRRSIGSHACPKWTGKVGEEQRL